VTHRRRPGLPGWCQDLQPGAAGQQVMDGLGSSCYDVLAVVEDEERSRRDRNSPSRSSMPVSPGPAAGDTPSVAATALGTPALSPTGASSTSQTPSR